MIASHNSTPSDPQMSLASCCVNIEKHKVLPWKKKSGLSNLSIKFLSDLERGKAIFALRRAGLDVIIQPRGYQEHKK